MLKRQNGNALWFILITIALFGALTAMLSRNSGSVNQSGDIEQSRIKASALLRYSKSVETTVQQMRLNGTSENDLDFVAIDAAHDNPNCTDTSCEVFGAEGGGIQFKSPSDIVDVDSYTGSWHVSTANFVYQVGCNDSNNSCTELLLLATDMPRDICLQVNAILDTSNPSGDAPQINEIIEGTAYTGAYDTTINGDAIGGTNAANEAPELRGKMAGCVFEFGSAQNKYHFYQVLIPR